LTLWLKETTVYTTQLVNCLYHIVNKNTENLTERERSRKRTWRKEIKHFKFICLMPSGRIRRLWETLVTRSLSLRNIFFCSVVVVCSLCGKIFLRSFFSPYEKNLEKKTVVFSVLRNFSCLLAIFILDSLSLQKV